MLDLGRLGNPADRERQSGGRAGRQVPLRRGRVHHRPAVLQGCSEHRHPCRPPVGGRRHDARRGDLHERERVRLAAGQPRLSGADHRGHDLRRLLPRAERQLRVHQRLLRDRRHRQPAAARARRRRGRAERGLPVWLRGRLPDRHLPVEQLLGRPRLRHRGGAGRDAAHDQRPIALQRRERGRHRHRRDRHLQRGDGREHDQRQHGRAARPLERARPRRRQLQLRAAAGDPGSERRAAALHHLHGDREGRHERRQGHGRERARRRLDLVVHHRGPATAAAGRRARGADPRGLELVQPVRPLLRRDPARGGAERVHGHGHLERQRRDARRP